MQDNSKIVAISNEIQDLKAKWKGGKMPISVCRKLTELEYASTKEWNRMGAEQAAGCGSKGLSLLLLLACLFVVGCGQNGRMVTTTAHQVVQQHNQDEPVGNFEITQTRFQSDGSPWYFDSREFDREGKSDVVVAFRNSTNRTINLNFVLSGHGWCVKDGVVALKPDGVYTTQRINVPYNALDYWRLTTSNLSFNKE